MPTPNTPIVNQGLLYVNNLQLSAGALNADNLTTATVIVAAGQCRDSTDTNDITLSAAATLNPVASNQAKVNGLDTGTIAIDTLYAVYVIADSTGYRTTGTLLSTNFTTPILPFGYDMFRRVGAVVTAHAAARFVYFHQRGNGATKDMWYAYNNQCLNAGAPAANTLTVLNLTGAAGNIANQVPITAGKAYVFASLAADAGGTRSAIFAADNVITCANGGNIAASPGTGEVIMSSPASTTTNASLIIPCTPSAGPVLPMQTYYAISAQAGGCSLSVSVQGYQDLL